GGRRGGMKHRGRWGRWRGSRPRYEGTSRMRSPGLPENCYEMPSSTRTHTGSKRKSATTITFCVYVSETTGRALIHTCCRKVSEAATGACEVFVNAHNE